jgi:predicted ATPase
MLINEGEIMIKKDRQILVFNNAQAGSYYDNTKWAYNKKQDLLKEGYNVVKEMNGKKLIKINDGGTYQSKFNPTWNTIILER